MLSRTLLVAASPLARRALTLNTPSVAAVTHRLAHGHGPPAGYKFPSMDELPVPCGSWQEHYDNNQRKYNIHLLFGVGFFIITVVCGYYCGIFNFYHAAPEKPGPRRTPE